MGGWKGGGWGGGIVLIILLAGSVLPVPGNPYSISDQNL